MGGNSGAPAIPESETAEGEEYTHDSWAAYYFDQQNQRTYMVTETSDRFAYHQSQLQIEINTWNIPILIDSGASRTANGEKWTHQWRPGILSLDGRINRSSRFGGWSKLSSLGAIATPLEIPGNATLGGEKFTICIQSEIADADVHLRISNGTL